ncbi:MAG: hypothetical protein Q8M76_18220, partial [Spirochaetaceae bacterium]|nr:hypothetical protein [Spirochaetaceae bacterium]
CLAAGESRLVDAEGSGAGASSVAGASLAADRYERVMRHREFTGRSGAMFGFEGLGCIHWHMVAKLLLAAPSSPA